MWNAVPSSSIHVLSEKEKKGGVREDPLSSCSCSRHRCGRAAVKKKEGGTGVVHSDFAALQSAAYPEKKKRRKVRVYLHLTIGAYAQKKKKRKKTPRFVVSNAQADSGEREKKKMQRV